MKNPAGTDLDIHNIIDSNSVDQTNIGKLLFMVKLGNLQDLKLVCSLLDSCMSAPGALDEPTGSFEPLLRKKLNELVFNQN